MTIILIGPLLVTLSGFSFLILGGLTILFDRICGSAQNLFLQTYGKKKWLRMYVRTRFVQLLFLVGFQWMLYFVIYGVLVGLFPFPYPLSMFCFYYCYLEWLASLSFGAGLLAFFIITSGWLIFLLLVNL